MTAAPTGHILGVLGCLTTNIMPCHFLTIPGVVPLAFFFNFFNMKIAKANTSHVLKEI